MATRTTYTSTISVPVFASWRCSNCGEINCSQGYIACKRGLSTSSLSSSKQEEVKNEAANQAQKEWKQNALDVIFNPQKDPQKMRSSLFFESTNCTKCGKKPKWDKGMGYLLILSLAFGPGIISGIVAIALRTSWIAWLIFAVFLGAIIYSFVSEELYKKTIKNLPAVYLPVIGSLNEELIMAAEQQGKILPSPDETIQLVHNLKVASEGNPPIDSIKVEEQNITSKADHNRKDKEQVCYCRKCGAKLPEGSAFCNKCGTAIIH